MALLVVDASVAMKWLIPEDSAEDAERIYRGTVEMIAPAHWKVELANAIWKKFLVRRQISRAEAAAAHDLLATLRVSVHDLEPLHQDAFRLALDHGITVYDALYVALAQREACEFVTADRRLVNTLGASFGGTIVALEDFAGRP